MPGVGRGINATQLSSLAEYYGGIPFEVYKQTNASESTYKLFPGGAPMKCRVLAMRGIMTGAGAAADTVALQDGDGNVIIAAIAVDALADKDVFDASTIDDAYWDIDAGEELNIVTVSGALAFVTVKLVNVEDL